MIPPGIAPAWARRARAELPIPGAAALCERSAQRKLATVAVAWLRWNRLHRWLAIVLVLPLVVWSVTGLLFHLKPGWARAYDMLSDERPLDAPVHAGAPPAAATDAPTAGSPDAPAAVSLDALATAAGGQIQRVELFGSALGPLYRVTIADSPVLLDAGLHRRSPLSLDDARALAADAVAHSAHRDAYGAIGTARIEGANVRVAFAGADVDVDRASGSIAQRGRDTDRIDWLYRLHYLSWTGNRTLDRGLAVAGLALIWLVMIPGLVLFVRGRRRSQP